jgi:hypothetical protein
MAALEYLIPFFRGWGLAAATIDTTALLQAHLDEALARFAQEGLTAAQERALISNPSLRAMFEGERFDAFFRQSVARDPSLQFLELTPRGQFGPDIWDPVQLRWWDVTTPTQWGSHLQKYWLFGDGIPLFH